MKAHEQKSRRGINPNPLIVDHQMYTKEINNSGGSHSEKRNCHRVDG